MGLLYLSTQERGAVWRRALANAMPDLPFWTSDDAVLDEVRYVACWTPPDDLFARYPNTELLISVGAGADQFDLSRVPEHVRVARMITPGIASMMRDYVTLGVLALHRDLPRYAAQQRQSIWQSSPVQLAHNVKVGVMGLGQLGTTALRALVPFGYVLSGWSRSPREIDGVNTFTGSDGLDAFLASQDIVICLLPLTPDTQGLMDARFFSKMKRGAKLLNAGRGSHLVQEDLINALNNGQIGAAMLDVTTPEPLPKDHPLWSHPRVIITPHTATDTDAEEGASCLIRILSAFRAGERFAEEVNRGRGY